MNLPDSSEPVARPPRLLSLDALRGFDMLWIIGAETIVHLLAKLLQTPWLDHWAQQLSHVKWEGVRAYDLIFPLFMFLSGVAIPLSLGSRLDRGDSKLQMSRKILTRVVMLVLLGFIYNGLLANDGKPRLPSVLGQIGIAWGIAAWLFLIVRGTWQRVACIAGVIGAITILQLLVPVPGIGAGVLTKEGAINAWLDRLILPGKLHGGMFDPEGLLCIFSASSLTLAGALAGTPLRKPENANWRMAGWFLLAGAAMIGAGCLTWSLGYPPIKALWTGTFDLLAIGISLMVFGVFFGVIDVFKWQAWSLPLRVVGMNALTIYLVVRFFSFLNASGLLLGRLAKSCGEAGPVILACGVLILEWLFLWFLYRRKIFLRV